jgi:adhesin/invasin
MKIWLLIFCCVLSGCSSVSGGWNKTIDFVFGPDDGNDQRQTKAAEIVSGAATSSEPEKVILENVMQKSADHLVNSTAAAIDNTFSNSKTDFTVDAIRGKKLRLSVNNVKGFEPSDNGLSQSFIQSSIGNASSRYVVNLGLGHRFLNDDETMLTGINAFFDYDLKYGHQRVSLGGEVKTSTFEFTANSYKALTNNQSGVNKRNERALDGNELELGMQVPYLPGSKFYLKNWNWKGEDGNADTKGNTYSLEFSRVANGTTFEVGRRSYDGSTKDENFVQITYSFLLAQNPSESRGPMISNEMFESSSMKSRMLDKVRRNNAIVIKTEFTAGIGGV